MLITSMPDLGNFLTLGPCSNSQPPLPLLDDVIIPSKQQAEPPLVDVELEVTTPDLGNFLTLGICSSSQPPVPLTDDVIIPSKQQQSEGLSESGDVELEVTTPVVTCDDVIVPSKQQQSEELPVWVTCDDVIIPSKHQQSEEPPAVWVTCDDVTQQQSEQAVGVCESSSVKGLEMRLGFVMKNERLRAKIWDAYVIESRNLRKRRAENLTNAPKRREEIRIEGEKWAKKITENGIVRDKTFDDYVKQYYANKAKEEAARVEQANTAKEEAARVEQANKAKEEAAKVEQANKAKKEAARVEQAKKLFLPFLVGAPKSAECFVCESVIDPGEEVQCVVRDCKGSYHLKCAKDSLGYSPSSKGFKCPQHACFVCKKKGYLWRCSRCPLASHDKCLAYPEYVQPSDDFPWEMVCWRHADNWPPLKPAVPTNSIEEVFSRLPLPYVADEFKIDLPLRDTVENKPEPPSYLHIRRNSYLVKKKRDDTDMTTGCDGYCSSNCSENCICRSQSISCSKACGCSERCTNKPFRKEKKIKIVLTELCGWGVEAAESIKKGEFIIEYVGEVISDALCEQRLWDMKNKGIKNFYMCEIRKDFTIDATFKGNASRFLNHSCGPNCNLEKWHVDGETRVGVFAARSIETGEPLTYDYRFVQFGPEVKCHCGALTCQGYLGTKKKIPKLPQLPNWGAQRRRTPTATLRMIRS